MFVKFHIGNQVQAQECLNGLTAVLFCQSVSPNEPLPLSSVASEHQCHFAITCGFADDPSRR